MGRQPKKGCTPYLENPRKFVGPFRTNVKEFLERHGTLRSPPQTSKQRGTLLYSRVWTVPLHCTEKASKHKPPLQLYVFEQRMIMDNHVVYCDNCRVAGWNSHPVCNFTYHFILPVNKPDIKWRGGESAVHASLLENQTHLLHGAIHINGFGHLLRVNGFEGGSVELSGRHLMEFWTNLCTMLKARVITVEDVSQKSGLPYRLLHTISRKTTWYGKWGYSFCRGPFGITEATWKAAAANMHNFPLAAFTAELSKHNIPFLPSLTPYHENNEPPKTLGQLMKRILYQTNVKLMTSKGRTGLTGRANHESKPKFKQSLIMNMEAANVKIEEFQFPACRWSSNRLQLAAYVVLNTLSANNTWMSRQDVRDSARQYIGDTGLLDFVLKVMGNQVIGGNLIRREFNAVTRVLEYKLEVLNGEKPLPLVLPTLKSHNSNRKKNDANPKNDLKILYNALVHGIDRPHNSVKYPVLSWHRDVRVLIDTKQFERNYYGESGTDVKEVSNSLRNMLRLLVTVKLDEEISSHKVAIPYEILVLPESSSVEQLKEAVCGAMREIYGVFEHFSVKDIISGIRTQSPVSDDTRLRNLKVDKFIVAEGTGMSNDNMLYHVGAVENWVVDCICGTKDDDGERMVECDRCNVWVHTRCYGYPDSGPCPDHFLCVRCAKHHRSA